LLFKHRGRKWKLTLDNGYHSYVYPFPNHDAGEVNIWTQNVDFHELQFVKKHLKPADVIYDIGCNVGNRTLALADTIAGGVLVDAGSYAIERANEHLQLNRLADRFTTIHAAVGAISGVVRFSNVGGASTVNRILDDADPGAEYEEVRLVTVDEIVRTTGKIPAFLKIDTEGNDFEVLRGAVNLIRSGKLRLIQFERLPTTDLAGIREFLAGAGWTVFTLRLDVPATDDATLNSSQNIFTAPVDYFKSAIGK